MCGADLLEGQRYLVFANADDSRGGLAPPADGSTPLVTSKCGLTRVFDAEARRLERLLGRPRAKSVEP
jgi:hypothetical protein